jgi:hypothetical protein
LIADTASCDSFYVEPSWVAVGVCEQIVDQLNFGTPGSEGVR